MMCSGEKGQGRGGGSGFVVESRRMRREGGLARIERKGEDRDRTGERERSRRERKKRERQVWR